MTTTFNHLEHSNCSSTSIKGLKWGSIIITSSSRIKTDSSTMLPEMPVNLVSSSRSSHRRKSSQYKDARKGTAVERNVSMSAHVC